MPIIFNIIEKHKTVDSTWKIYSGILVPVNSDTAVRLRMMMGDSMDVRK